MFRRKKKPTERLPWYRERNFKGNLTENEKRQLNSFRMRESHPAATNGSLPEEVQRYISSLEMEVYDRKQGSLSRGLSCCERYWRFFPRPVYSWLSRRFILGVHLGSLFARIAVDLLPYPMEEKRRRVFATRSC